MYRIYFDVCCLNRPFNDQSQERIRLEAEAVLLVMERLRAGDWYWVSSEAVAAEVDRTRDIDHRRRLRTLANAAAEVVGVGPAEVERAREIIALGCAAFDALHLACAESARADVFLTTDDRLLRFGIRIANQLGVRVVNPLAWLEEVTG